MDAQSLGIRDEDFKKLDERDTENLEEMAHHLYEVYIHPDAALSVNINHQQMVRVENALKDVSSSVMDQTPFSR